MSLSSLKQLLAPHIFAAEFDLKKGAILSSFYSKSGAKITEKEQGRLAELMIPEGAHHRQIDWTTFLLYSYEFQDKKLFLYDETTVPDAVPDGHSSATRIYCVACCQTLRDETTTRGARLKSIAVASNTNLIDLYRPLIQCSVENWLHFNPSDAVETVLESLYESFRGISITHSLASDPVEKDLVLVRRAFSRCEGDTKHLQHLLPSLMIQRTIHQDANTKMELPLWLPKATLFNSSVAFLLDHLSLPELVLIYNAVLLHKRILIIGDRHVSADLLARAVGGVAQLISPPDPNPWSRLHTYVSLHEVHVVDKPGCICGATNPMVLQAAKEKLDLVIQLSVQDVTHYRHQHSTTPISVPDTHSRMSDTSISRNRSNSNTSDSIELSENKGYHMFISMYNVHTSVHHPSFHSMHRISYKQSFEVLNDWIQPNQIPQHAYTLIQNYLTEFCPLSHSTRFSKLGVRDNKNILEEKLEQFPEWFLNDLRFFLALKKLISAGEDESRCRLHLETYTSKLLKRVNVYNTIRLAAECDLHRPLYCTSRNHSMEQSLHLQNLLIESKRLESLSRSPTFVSAMSEIHRLYHDTKQATAATVQQPTISLSAPISSVCCIHCMICRVWIEPFFTYSTVSTDEVNPTVYNSSLSIHELLPDWHCIAYLAGYFDPKSIAGSNMCVWTRVYDSIRTHIQINTPRILQLFVSNEISVTKLAAGLFHNASEVRSACAALVDSLDHATKDARILGSPELSAAWRASKLNFVMAAALARTKSKAATLSNASKDTI